MRYVLSTFVYDPITWIDRYGWRPLTDHERIAAFQFYREVGHRMGIRRCGRRSRLGVRGMLEPAMLTAFGLPPAPRWVHTLGDAGLRARARAVRWLLPPRRRSRLGVSPRNRTYPGYPDGYQVSDLGAPPADLDPRWLRPRDRAQSP